MRAPHTPLLSIGEGLTNVKVKWSESRGPGRSDGELKWLYFPREYIDEDKSVAEVSPEDFSLFAYGMDLGKSLPLPPHLCNFGFMNPQLDSKAIYAVHFVPVDGYDVPVYRIVIDEDSIAAPMNSGEMWGFSVKCSPISGRHSCFWFRFRKARNGDS